MDIHPTPSHSRNKWLMQQGGGEAPRHRLGLAVVMLRRGSEPPVLQHREEDIAIVVLSGYLTILVDTVNHECAPGSHVVVPRDGCYGFALQSEAVRLLMIVVPGGAEEWFAELQAMLDDETSTAGMSSWSTEMLVSSAAHHAINLVGPAPHLGRHAHPTEPCEPAARG